MAKKNITMKKRVNAKEEKGGMMERESIKKRKVVDV